MKRTPELGAGGSSGDVDDDKPSSFSPHKSRTGRSSAAVWSIIKWAAAYVTVLLVARALRRAALPVSTPLFSRVSASEDSANLYADTVDDEAPPPPPPVVQAAVVPVPAWYSATTRYLVFQPSGGISNQRKILSWALRVVLQVQPGGAAGPGARAHGVRPGPHARPRGRAGRRLA